MDTFKLSLHGIISFFPHNRLERGNLVGGSFPHCPRFLATAQRFVSVRVLSPLFHDNYTLANKGGIREGTCVDISIQEHHIVIRKLYSFQPSLDSVTLDNIHKGILFEPSREKELI